VKQQENTMEIALLPVKPGTLSDEDKANLAKAGIVVIEHAEPDTLRLLTPTAELSGGDLLWAAMHALTGPSNSASTSCQADFARAVGRLIREKREPKA
jgi:hypothetical protein